MICAIVCLLKRKSKGEVKVDTSYNQSDDIKNLMEAQLAMQQEIKDIAKDSTGYGYNYTSFDKLVQYLRPLMAQHGLTFIQMPVGQNSHNLEYPCLVGVKTVYMHAPSGQWIGETLLSPIAGEHKGMTIYQSIGSAITYFRRYSLSSFAGIASEEDVDAASSGHDNDNEDTGW